MRLIYSVTFALAASVALASDQPGHTFQFGPFVVRELVGGDFAPGYGCVARYPASRKQAGAPVARWGDEPRVLIRVEGSLRSFDADEPFSGWPNRVGGSSDTTYQNLDLQAELALVSTSVGSPSSDSCRSATFRGTLSLWSEARHVTKRVWAECTCAAI